MATSDREAQEAVQALVRLVRPDGDDGPPGRWDNVSPMLEALVKKLLDPDASVRVSTIEVLEKLLDLPDPASRAQLWDVIEFGLADPSSQVKQCSASRLTRIVNSHIVPCPEGDALRPSMERLLIANTSDPDEWCRMYTAYALGRWKVWEATDILLDLMNNDPSARVRSAAVDAVGVLAKIERDAG